MTRRVVTAGLAVAVTAGVAASALAAVPLTMHKARIAARQAAQPFADLIDAKTVNLTACRRLRVNRIDCAARINGAQQTCTMRLPVIREPNVYVVSARDVHCLKH